MILCAVLLWASPPARGNEQAIKAALLADPKLDLYFGDRMVCGPMSVYFAVGSVGHQPDLSDVVQHVPVSEHGSSLEAVTDYFGRVGIESYSLKTARLAALLSCVRAGERCLLLLVDEDRHFVTVAASPSGELLVLDDGDVTPLEKSGIAERYSGVATIVGSNARLQASARLMTVPAGAASVALVAGSSLGSYGAARVARSRAAANRLLPEGGVA